MTDYSGVGSNGAGRSGNEAPPSSDEQGWLKRFEERLEEIQAQAREAKHGAPAQPTVQCELCNDSEIQSLQDGTQVHCVCVRERWRKERVESIMTRSGLSEPDRRHTLGRYDPDRHAGAAVARAAVEEYVERWVEHRGSGRGLYIWGGVGLGKTHLAAAALVEVVERHLAEVRPRPSVLYSPTTQLMRLLSDFSGAREGKRSDPGEYMDVASEADLLVLDDVAQVRATAYRQEVVYEIIDRRYAARLPTILTSNVQLDALEPTFGAAVVSRLHAMCQELRVEGEDQRRATAGAG